MSDNLSNPNNPNELNIFQIWGNIDNKRKQIFDSLQGVISMIETNDTRNIISNAAENKLRMVNEVNSQLESDLNQTVNEIQSLEIDTTNAKQDLEANRDIPNKIQQLSNDIIKNKKNVSNIEQFIETYNQQYSSSSRQGLFTSSYAGNESNELNKKKNELFRLKNKNNDDEVKLQTYQNEKQKRQETLKRIEINGKKLQKLKNKQTWLESASDKYKTFIEPLQQIVKKLETKKEGISDVKSKAENTINDAKKLDSEFEEQKKGASASETIAFLSKSSTEINDENAYTRADRDDLLNGPKGFNERYQELFSATSTLIQRFQTLLQEFDNIDKERRKLFNNIETENRNFQQKLSQFETTVDHPYDQLSQNLFNLSGNNQYAPSFQPSSFLNNIFGNEVSRDFTQSSYRDQNGNIVHHQKNKVLSVNESSSSTSDADKWKESLQRREKELKALQKVLAEEEKIDYDDRCPDHFQDITKRVALGFNKNIIIKTTQFVNRFLEKLEDFEKKMSDDLTSYIKTQHNSYMDDLKILDEKFAENIVQLEKEKEKEREKEKGQNGGRQEEQKNDRKSRLMNKLYQDQESALKKRIYSILSFTRKSIRDYRYHHFDFIAKKIRKRVSYINNWRNNSELEDIIEKFKDELYKFDESIGKCSNKVKEYAKELNTIFQNQIQSFELRIGTVPQRFKKVISSARGDESRKLQNGILAEFQNINMEIGTMVDKTFMYYNDRVRMKHIIFDREFVFLYFLKSISFVFLLFSVYLIENIFVSKCKENGTVLQKDPPNILMFVLICYGVHIAFIFILLTILLIFSLIFTSIQHTFIINSHTLVFFLFDYALCLLFHTILSLIYAYFVQKKRYFRYKLESLRGLRSLTDFMLYTGIVIFSVPFFMIKWT